MCLEWAYINLLGITLSLIPQIQGFWSFLFWNNSLFSLTGYGTFGSILNAPYPSMSDCNPYSNGLKLKKNYLVAHLNWEYNYNYGMHLKFHILKILHFLK